MYFNKSFIFYEEYIASIFLKAKKLSYNALLPKANTLIYIAIHSLEHPCLVCKAQGRDAKVKTISTKNCARTNFTVGYTDNLYIRFVKRHLIYIAVIYIVYIGFLRA